MSKAIIISDADFSSASLATLAITVQQPVITFDLVGNATIVSPGGDDIYYTTDGSTPTTASTKYNGTFAVQQDTEVKAVCWNGGKYSSVSSNTYDGTLSVPVISVAANGAVTITAADGTSIRYTTDGSDPTTSTGTLYESPFVIPAGPYTIKAIAYIDNIASSVATATGEIAEGVTYGKKFTSSNTTIPADDQLYCITPFIAIDRAKDLIYKWNQTITANNPFCLVTYDSNKGYLDFFNARSSDGSQRTIYASQFTKGGEAYIRATFIVGVAGSIEQNGNALFAYDGSSAPS